MISSLSSAMKMGKPVSYRRVLATCVAAILGTAILTTGEQVHAQDRGSDYEPPRSSIDLDRAAGTFRVYAIRGSELQRWRFHVGQSRWILERTFPPIAGASGFNPPLVVQSWSVQDRRQGADNTILQRFNVWGTSTTTPQGASGSNSPVPTIVEWAEGFTNARGVPQVTDLNGHWAGRNTVPFAATMGTPDHASLADQELSLWTSPVARPQSGGKWLNVFNSRLFPTSYIQWAWNLPGRPYGMSCFATWCMNTPPAGGPLNSFIAGPLSFSPDSWYNGRPEFGAVGMIDSIEGGTCCSVQLISQAHGNALFAIGPIETPRPGSRLDDTRHFPRPRMRSIRPPIVVAYPGGRSVYVIVQTLDGAGSTPVDPDPSLPFPRPWVLVSKTYENGRWPRGWQSEGSPDTAFPEVAVRDEAQGGYQPGFDLTALVVWKDENGRDRFNMFGATDTNTGIVEFADLGNGDPIWGNRLHTPPSANPGDCRLGSRQHASSAAYLPLPGGSNRYRVSVLVECVANNGEDALWELAYDTRQGSVWRWKKVF